MNERLIQSHERKHHKVEEGLTSAQKGFLAVLAVVSVANGTGAYLSLRERQRAHDFLEEATPEVSRLSDSDLEGVYERLDILEKAVCDPATGAIPGIFLHSGDQPPFAPDLQVCLQWAVDKASE